MRPSGFLFASDILDQVMEMSATEQRQWAPPVGVHPPRAKGQAADTAIEITQVLEPNRHFKAAIIKMLHQAITTCLEQVGEKGISAKKQKMTKWESQN